VHRTLSQSPFANQLRKPTVAIAKCAARVPHFLFLKAFHFTAHTLAIGNCLKGTVNAYKTAIPG
jgi:hypothetical protein